MESSTTIRKMLTGNIIIVPTYQRAYSWDTPDEKIDRVTQTDIFLNDLEEFRNSDAKSSYYFGHFLFEDRNNKFYVIDGQQRLTTIVILLSTIFTKLKTIRCLNEDEEFCYEDMVKRGSKIIFSTVDYDNQLFIDYVIDQTKSDQFGLETESARRISRAFNFFCNSLSDKNEEYLTKMLSIISGATCSTHLVQNESEAIQMFIFQNNRGKRPSNLEIVKAQFMYNVHLYGDGEKDTLIDEIKNRFEKIYKSISSIEYQINEDDVLLYTLRIHFNSLWESNPLERIDKELSQESSIDFIKDFTQSLSISFEHLSSFFGKHERENFEIHSLVTLGGIGIALPFIIKAYKYDLSLDQIGKLCASLETLVLRHRLIGTRANIVPRINDVFEKFIKSKKDINPIIDRIKWMQTSTDWWWSYWNNERFDESLQGLINHRIAKYLLWKYENHLRSLGKSGYPIMRFNDIKCPELEHIAPTKEPNMKPHGYDKYDEEFLNQYINCLGNYLLLSKSHNASIHNDPFPKKLKDYCYLAQQREIQKYFSEQENILWSKELIRCRKKKIIEFILDAC